MRYTSFAVKFQAFIFIPSSCGRHFLFSAGLLINYLSAQLGAPVEFRSARNYDLAQENLINGNVHFSYLGPSPFALLDEQYPGKIRIAAAVVNKGGSPTFQGVIVVKEDSPIKSLADLQARGLPSATVIPPSPVIRLPIC